MNILFNEKQKIDSLWPLLLTAIVLAVNWWLYFRMGYEDMTFFYVCLIIIGLLSLFIGMLRLETEINEKEIRYKFYPFSRKWQTIALNQVSNLQLRQYKVFKEFGGRGNRRRKNTKAMTLNGNQGLQITLKNKQIILIGTQRPDEIGQVISTLRLK